jgi:hypothetical protein
MKNRTAVKWSGKNLLTRKEAKAKTSKLKMVQLWDPHGLWQDERGQFYTGKCGDHHEEAQPIGKVRAVSATEAARWYMKWSPENTSSDGIGSANRILEALLRASVGPVAPVRKVLSSPVSPVTYGTLCEAGMRHGGIGADEMLEVLLNKSDVIVNWANSGFPTDLTTGLI